MLQLTLTQDGETRVVDFPEHPHEVTLNAFIDYEKAVAKLTQWRQGNRDKDFNSAKYRADELRHVIACINAFLGKDVSQTPLHGFKISSRNMPDKSVETAVFTVFNLCAVTINSYQYQPYAGDYWFTYKGRKYTLPQHYIDGVTQQSRFADLTCAQAVEAYEAVRLFQTVQEQDEDGGFLFKTILNLIACLATEDGGDAFPTSESDIQRFISDRILYFSEIDMATALDVYNFFFATIRPFAPTHGTGGSSSRRKSRPVTNTKQNGAGSGNQKTMPSLSESDTGTFTTDSSNPGTSTGTLPRQTTARMRFRLNVRWPFFQIKTQGYDQN